MLWLGPWKRFVWQFPSDTFSRQPVHLHDDCLVVILASGLLANRRKYDPNNWRRVDLPSRLRRSDGSRSRKAGPDSSSHPPPPGSRRGGSTIRGTNTSGYLDLTGLGNLSCGGRSFLVSQRRGDGALGGAGAVLGGDRSGVREPPRRVRLQPDQRAPLATASKRPPGEGRTPRK